MPTQVSAGDSETGPLGLGSPLSSNETRQKCSDSMAAVGTSNLAPGVLLPVPVYRYRKWGGQMTAQLGYDQLEAAARNHAWQYGHSLRSILDSRPDAGSAIPWTFPRDHGHRLDTSA